MSKAKKKAVIEALEKSLGVVTTACKATGVGRTTFYDWLKTDQEFAKQVKDIENIAVDFAESKLHKQIQNDNITAIIFFLKCKGKERGYIEQQRIEHSGEIFTKTLQEVEEELESIEKQLGAIDV